MTTVDLTDWVTLLAGTLGAGGLGTVLGAWLRGRARTRAAVEATARARVAADADVERSRVIADERRDVAALEHDARVAPVLAEYLRSVDARLAASDERHRGCEARATACEERGRLLEQHVRHVEEHSAELSRDVQRMARRLAAVLPCDEITGLQELRAIARRPTPTPPDFELPPEGTP